MPKELPLSPNLGHLKKQAKALLHDFRRKEPQAVAKFRTLRLKVAPKLSDAQHLIARDYYGLNSWSKLKEHVESLAARSAEAVDLAEESIPGR